MWHMRIWLKLMPSAFYIFHLLSPLGFLSPDNGGTEGDVGGGFLLFSYLSVSADHPLVSGDFLEGHRTASMEFLGADTYLSS